jgi:UDP-GlcNAc:undecaprenyl-phosphate GlcNAc-1-phosphate transferase
VNEAAPWYAPWLGPEGLSAAAWGTVAAAATAAAVVLLTVPPLRRIAWFTAFLDHPEARKLHAHATPLLGGVAVGLGVVAGFAAGAWVGQLPLPEPWPWWGLGAAAALLLGLYDDRLGMRPGLKLALQFGIALLFLVGGDYPQAFGPVPGFLLSLLWIAGLMNAINFLDNMDGIVGGITAILAAGLGVLLYSFGRSSEAVAAVALAAASFAFLRYNFSPACIFLGDAGSMLLGYGLATISLVAAKAGVGFQASAAALLILGYPVFDMCFVVVRRLREGRKIYEGGKDHTTHRLSRLVNGPRRTAAWVYFVAASLTWTGVALAHAKGTPEVLLWLSAWAIGLLLFGLRLARVPAQ